MRGFDDDEMHAYLLRRWRRLLFTLAFLPALGLYPMARGHDVGNVPAMLALFGALELFVLWSFRRRRLFWFGRRY